MNAEQLITISKKYAEKQDFQLNPDTDLVNEIVHGMLKNEKKFGYRYCPCRTVTGDQLQDAHIICPCVYHKDEIKQMRHCLCGLFVAKV